MTHHQQSSDVPMNNNESLLKDDLQQWDNLEVAHILPHSLMKSKKGSELICLSIT